MNNIIIFISKTVYFYKLLLILPQVTGDVKWVLAGINSLAEQCLFNVAKDFSLWTNITGLFLPDQDIVNNICINDCYQFDSHGICSGGKPKMK